MRYSWIAVLLASATSLAAQETRDTFALNQLVVSVARLPIERAAASAAVTVLSGDQLRTRGVRTVADALRTVSGAALAQGGAYGTFGSLFLRGGESDYVQVLIDGVRVNSPGEHFDFGSFTLENIDRIEVVRGPVSVLYGSDAVTGIVQLFTKQGRGTRYDFAARAGMGDRIASQQRFGVEAIDAGIGGGNARANYSFGLAHFRSDGAYAFNSRNHNTGVTGRIGYALDPATAFNATVRFNRNDLHYPTDGAGNLVDQNQRDLTNSLAAGLEIARALSPRLEARALISIDRNDDRYRDAPDNSGDTLGFYAGSSTERFQHEAVDLRLNYLLAPQATLTVGGEYDGQHERGASRTESEFGPFTGSSRDSRNTRALYGQLLSSLGRVNLQAGARVDDNDRYGAFATWRGGLSARVSGHVRLRASAGTSFKQPRFYEQFATGFVKGNPELAPEQSRSIDAGAEFFSTHWRLSGTGFTQRFHNLIQYIANPAQDEPNYRNLGAARSNGIEVEAEHAAGAFSLHAAYTFLHTKVIDPGTGQDPLFQAGRDLLRRPRHSASLTLAYSGSAWRVSGTTSYVGRRDDLDFNNYPSRMTLGSYTRVDVALDRRLGALPVRGTVNVENLFAADYQEIFNFPARGRMVFVGMKLEK